MEAWRQWEHFLGNPGKFFKIIYRSRGINFGKVLPLSPIFNESIPKE